ncbi:MAG: hypothetical protein NTZ54_17150 [Alphaproteobacteria bacterium]|nr:hypothetical protein [Alphaproteobacteria bacterium]
MGDLFNFESRDRPVACKQAFINRLTRGAAWTVGIVAASLLLGTWGYIYFGNMRAIDAFDNAAMLLSGEGPLAPPSTAGGKIFAALYAVASGFLLLGLTGLMLAPVFHRILHRFHVD